MRHQLELFWSNHDVIVTHFDPKEGYFSEDSQNYFLGTCVSYFESDITLKWRESISFQNGSKK